MFNAVQMDADKKTFDIDSSKTKANKVKIAQQCSTYDCHQYLQIIIKIHINKKLKICWITDYNSCQHMILVIEMISLQSCVCYVYIKKLTLTDIDGCANILKDKRRGI